MLQEPRHSLPPAADRRAALWPWLVMPAAALAIFFALQRVRHSTDMPPSSNQSSDVSSDGDD